MKIAIIGNKKSTKKLIESLISFNVKIHSLITLDNSVVEKYKVAGRDDELLNLCEKNNINVHLVTDYKLGAKSDKDFFQKENFDVGLCTGWQRLIPIEILASVKIGIFGWHGSMFSLPNGRGRSPINWSIRLGANAIYHNLFRYDEGADDGLIFETEIIAIDSEDYIEDVIFKAETHIIESSRRLILALESDLTLLRQASHAHLTLPKLSEDDGEIFSRLMSSRDIYNMVRSCSRPFPGAFLSWNKKKLVRVWRVEILDKSKINLNSGFAMMDGDSIVFGCKDGMLSSSLYEILSTELKIEASNTFEID